MKLTFNKINANIKLNNVLLAFKKGEETHFFEVKSLSCSKKNNHSITYMSGTCSFDLHPSDLIGFSKIPNDLKMTPIEEGFVNVPLNKPLLIKFRQDGVNILGSGILKDKGDGGAEWSVGVEDVQMYSFAVIEELNVNTEDKLSTNALVKSVIEKTVIDNSLKEIGDLDKKIEEGNSYVHYLFLLSIGFLAVVLSNNVTQNIFFAIFLLFVVVFTSKVGYSALLEANRIQLSLILSSFIDKDYVLNYKNKKFCGEIFSEKASGYQLLLIEELIDKNENLTPNELEKIMKTINEREIDEVLSNVMLDQEVSCMLSQKNVEITSKKLWLVIARKIKEYKEDYLYTLTDNELVNKKRNEILKIQQSLL